MQLNNVNISFIQTQYKSLYENARMSEYLPHNLSHKADPLLLVTLQANIFKPSIDFLTWLQIFQNTRKVLGKGVV